MKRSIRSTPARPPMLLVAIESNPHAQKEMTYRMEKLDPKGGGMSMFYTEEARTALDYTQLGWSCDSLVSQYRVPVEMPSFRWDGSVVHLSEEQRVSASISLDGLSIIFQLRQMGEDLSAVAFPLEVYDAMVKCAQQARRDAKALPRPTTSPLPPNLTSWNNKTPKPKG